MKKSLIALAVASAFAAPAFAATGNVDVYGQVRMSVDYIDTDGVGSKWQIEDRVSRIGFKGSEDLGGGLKAIWQIEQQITVDGGNTPAVGTTTVSSVTVVTSVGASNGNAFGGAGLRNTFVGLSGDFGTVLIGRHDTPYKLAGSADLFGDTVADSQGTTGIIGSKTGTATLGFDTRATNTVAYVSPTWSGFHFAAAVIPGEAAGTKADGLMDAYSLAAVYSNGPLFLSAGYENLDNISTVVGSGADESAWKINGAYTFGDIKVGLTYENQDLAAGVDVDAWLASVAYSMGPITLALQYGDRDSDAGTAADKERWVLGAVYSLSKRTSTYLAYMSDDNGTGTADVDGWTIGLNHSF